MPIICSHSIETGFRWKRTLFICGHIHHCITSIDQNLKTFLFLEFFSEINTLSFFQFFSIRIALHINNGHFFCSWINFISNQHMDKSFYIFNCFNLKLASFIYIAFTSSAINLLFVKENPNFILIFNVFHFDQFV